MRIFLRACWQCSPNELTYLHCVIVNPIGWERLYDAHVAVKTKQNNTHMHTRSYSAELVSYKHWCLCAHDKVLRMVITWKLNGTTTHWSLSQKNWTILTFSMWTYTQTHQHWEGYLLDDGLASGLAVEFLVVLDDPVLTRTRGKGVSTSVCRWRPWALLMKRPWAPHPHQRLQEANSSWKNDLSWKHFGTQLKWDVQGDRSTKRVHFPLRGLTSLCLEFSSGLGDQTPCGGRGWKEHASQWGGTQNEDREMTTAGGPRGHSWQPPSGPPPPPHLLNSICPGRGKQVLTSTGHSWPLYPVSS